MIPTALLSRAQCAAAPVAPAGFRPSASPRGIRTHGFASRRGARSLLATLFLTTALHAEVLIERGYLPLEAAPSSFAIGLPGGINFCFDPVRGGISYVWTGGFLDVSAMRPGPGKFIAPARPLGPIAYRETGVAPLRRGEPSRAPVVEFAGYTLRDDAVEFRYTIDGVLVRETIRARPDGRALVRQFRIEGGADAKWWHVVDSQPATELKRDASGVFTLELPLVKPTAR